MPCNAFCLQHNLDRIQVSWHLDTYHQLLLYGLYLVVSVHSSDQTGVIIGMHRICWTSKASANQRAGRAGRTEPGPCYRYTLLLMFRATKDGGVGKGKLMTLSIHIACTVSCKENYSEVRIELVRTGNVGGYRWCIDGLTLSV